MISLQKNSARKTAMMINIVVALLATLKITVEETHCDFDNLKTSEIEKLFQELLHVGSFLLIVAVVTSCELLKEKLYASYLYERKIQLVQISEIRNLQSRLRIRKKIALCK